MTDLAKLAFQNAVWVAGHLGDKRRLLALLRADYRLTAKDKQYLADFIEGKVKRPAHRPRRVATDALHDPEWAAVIHAAFLVEQLKRGARKEGRGRSGIREWAVDQAMDLLEKQGSRRPARERLENYLRRSKKSRKRGPR
jgi:hypothetical protein